MSHEIRIRTLGSFVIERDGQVVDGFLTRKTALLFAYLAMHPGEHTRERLAFLLWSETTDAQALKNLRTVLSSLRKTVPEAVKIMRGMVQTVGTMVVDATQFEAGCAAVFAGEIREVDEMLAVAALYGGPFLSGMAIRQADSLDEWVEEKREGVAQVHGRLLHTIVERCLATGRLYDGVAVARQLVAINPLWEAAQRQLMLLLARLGQSGEAQLQYERVVALLDDELGVAPEAETSALYAQIRAGQIEVPAKQGRPAIVLPDLPYVPPKADYGALEAVLDQPDCRLVTLMGIGGVGKTMLATFMAHHRQGGYRDGVVIVALAAVRDEAGVAQAILGRLSVTVAGEATAAQVVAELRDKALLLVLDNYEQVMPATGLIAAILEGAPEVQILVTSQVALNLRQEWLVPVNGLQVQGAGDETPDESEQLFMATAQRILPQIDLAPYRREIGAICALLDGLPLGIVIAAGQLKYLSPPEILAMLQEDMLAMTASYQDLPARHQSFESVVQTMLARLSPQERNAMQALSLFRASFNHRAALAVAEIDMRTFVTLVDKSLIQRTENFRYTVHGLLRRVFAAELRDLGAAGDAVRQRFTAYYRAWCDDFYRQRPQVRDNLSVIDVEHGNIWHLEQLDDVAQERYLLEIIPAMQQYWRNRGFGEQVIEIGGRAVDNPVHPAALRARATVELALITSGMGRQAATETLLDKAIATDPDSLYVRVQALQISHRVAIQRGDYAESWALLEQVLALEPERARCDDPQIDVLLIGNHVGMGLAATEMGQIDTARLHFEIAMQGWVAMDEPLRQAQVLHNLAILDMREGKYAAAQQNFEMVLAAFRKSENDTLILIAAGNLGKALMKQGAYGAAFELLHEALVMAVRIKRKTSLLYQLETMTELAVLTGQYKLAAQLLGYVREGSTRDNIAFSPTTVTQMAVYAAAIEAAVGTAFGGLVAAGAAMRLEAAVEMATQVGEGLGNASMG